MSARAPSQSDMECAAAWLDCYEPDEDSDDERDACRRVAEWLRLKVEQADFRQACKGAGVSVAKGRLAARAAFRRTGVKA